MKGIWEPSSPDLEIFRTKLAPHIDQFRAIYRPIRHKFYAHKSKGSEAAISALFDNTLIGGVNRILGFLYTLLWCINDMAWNGHRPNLACFLGSQPHLGCIACLPKQYIKQRIFGARLSLSQLVDFTEVVVKSMACRLSVRAHQFLFLVMSLSGSQTSSTSHRH